MLFKKKDFENYYDLSCDNKFDLDGIQNKCIRNFVGNCIYNEIKNNIDIVTCTLFASAPQHIKNLVNGVEYTTTTNNSCCCKCDCDCDTRYWIGLRELVRDCIRYNYLCSYEAEINFIKDRNLTKSMYVRSLQNERLDVYNSIVYLNCDGDCNCVSLHTFIDDHTDDFDNFSGKIMRYQSLI